MSRGTRETLQVLPLNIKEQDQIRRFLLNDGMDLVDLYPGELDCFGIFCTRTAWKQPQFFWSGLLPRGSSGDWRAKIDPLDLFTPLHLVSSNPEDPEVTEEMTIPSASIRRVQSWAIIRVGSVEFSLVQPDRISRVTQDGLFAQAQVGSEFDFLRSLRLRQPKNIRNQGVAVIRLIPPKGSRRLSGVVIDIQTHKLLQVEIKPSIKSS